MWPVYPREVFVQAQDDMHWYPTHCEWASELEFQAGGKFHFIVFSLSPQRIKETHE